MIRFRLYAYAVVFNSFSNLSCFDSAVGMVFILPIPFITFNQGVLLMKALFSFLVLVMFSVPVTLMIF